MKILLCNTLESKGGAARSSRRIYDAIKRRNIDIEFLVAYGDSKSNDVVVRKDLFFRLFYKLIPYIESVVKRIFTRSKEPFSTSLIPFGFTRIIKSKSPNILHLNYINNGMLSIRDIGCLKIPIIWTLHDSWAFTGGCHLPCNYNCDNFKTECQYCKVVQSNKKSGLSSFILKEKKRLWKDRNITIVCPSKWLASCAKSSAIFSDKRVEVIPNPIDTSIFKPRDRKEACKRFNLEENKKYILFGAVNSLHDKNKGFEFLNKALEKEKFENTELIILGADTNDNIEIKYPYRNIGYITDEQELSYLYSAVDTCIVPSLSENLPNVILESLACGTPVIASNVGGIPEIITENRYGMLTEPKDFIALGDSISKILKNGSTNDIRRLRHKYIVENYSYSTVAEKYINLYKSILRDENSDI